MKVTIDGSPDVLLTRRDGYVWVLVPKGVHEVVASGLLGDSGNWEWTFLLKPKYVTINAAGWKISGVSDDGVPDSQVFFIKEQPVSDDLAAYDRTDFNPIVVVDRYLEIGLVSRLRSTVTRLSEPGKAISLQVPLLDDEGVLTSNREVMDGSDRGSSWSDGETIRLGKSAAQRQRHSVDRGDRPIAGSNAGIW